MPKVALLALKGDGHLAQLAIALEAPGLRRDSKSINGLQGPPHRSRRYEPELHKGLRGPDIDRLEGVREVRVQEAVLTSMTLIPNFLGTAAASTARTDVTSAFAV